MRMGEIEAGASGREGIEIRRLRRTAIAGERIRAQRVDGDEENVLVGAPIEGGRAASSRHDPADRAERNRRRGDRGRREGPGHAKV